MSLSEFASRCALSPSYITEIEKGRKYPKTDKILKMASVLEKDYDNLVSIKLSPSLTHLETILSSPLVAEFPFDEFGLDAGDIVSIFTRIPDKASALAHAILEIVHHHNIKEEHFLRAALRSYQEMHENYFQDLEDMASKFAKKYKLDDTDLPLSQQQLEDIMCNKFGYTLNTTDLVEHPLLSTYRSVYIDGKKPKLLLNAAMRPSQNKFLLAREMGYRYLKLEERAHTSAPDRVESFQQVLNDFKASYFAGALLMPRAAILADIQNFFQYERWNEQLLLDMLAKYDVTPEMLFYRLSELIPQFFGIRLHFLRFNGSNGNCKLIKHLNMNAMLLPNIDNLSKRNYDHWLAVRLLREMAAIGKVEQFNHRPLVGVQIDNFLYSRERILSFGIARPLALSPQIGSSVTIGFRITPELKNVIRFVDDSLINITVVNDEPDNSKAEQEKTEREAALAQLITEMKKA
ncbi:MAG: ImmA/IrrE family metallo-endopeptidase [Anaerolineae bacterium]|nr:ImmA/IrrE family metallo-endopeptidase [Anaerolineae bacterium]